MSKTTAVRAMDLYFSELAGITPSKLQSGKGVSLGRYSQFVKLPSELQRGEVVSLGPYSQVVKLPMTTPSESVEALQTALFDTFNSYITSVAEVLPQQVSGWTSLSGSNYQRGGTQHTRTADLSLLHDDVRPSNVLVFSLESRPESKQSAEEKRYKQLNQKYYDGTITEEEQRELVKIEEALDEADAKDPYLMKVKKTVEEGYDKLHSGLHRINKILDDLLAT